MYLICNLFFGAQEHPGRRSAYCNKSDQNIKTSEPFLGFELAHRLTVSSRNTQLYLDP